MLVNSDDSPQDDQPDDTQMPNPDQITDNMGLGTRGPRGSIYFDLKMNQLSYTPMAMARSLRMSIKKPVRASVHPKKITSEYLNSLTPDKLAELKYIFQICDPKNTGEFSYTQLDKRNLKLFM